MLFVVGNNFSKKSLSNDATLDKLFCAIFLKRKIEKGLKDGPALGKYFFCSQYIAMEPSTNINMAGSTLRKVPITHKSDSNYIKEHSSNKLTRLNFSPPNNDLGKNHLGQISKIWIRAMGCFTKLFFCRKSWRNLQTITKLVSLKKIQKDFEFEEKWIEGML